MAKLKMTQQELNDCLFEACQTSNVDYARLALASGANVNAKNAFKETPLHFAVLTGQIHLIRLLLGNGAHPEEPDAKNLAPAYYAETTGHPDIAELLKNAAQQQQGHAARVTGERKDKGPPQVGG